MDQNPFYPLRSNHLSLIVLALFSILPLLVMAQPASRYRVMFYNVENLFDTQNDTLINDEEFLPEGKKHWNEHRFYQKLNNIYKVIIHCGQWDPPALIGLCEVENRYVLDKLVEDTPLKKFEYQVVHFESPDWRGIDVALLYRDFYFEPDTAYPISVRFPFDPESRTRDILYVKGVLAGQETIHLFVNHWPSRYGGYQATVPKRNHTANILKHAVDSIVSGDPLANILIMGDFNDGPHDESMAGHLGARVDSTNIGSEELFNLTAIYDRPGRGGTLKYKENWDVFDQVIVSTSLLKKNPVPWVTRPGVQIFRPPYLFEEDEKYLGKKPFRTYAGPYYLGGFSDHLPVFLDLKFK